ncbi:protein root UVB sensitive 5 isoform X2 [Beta vulgaris subsp. vulgaris]|uniref:protein root UVB sensitive 5 isoform X2 n=1 Tax=Beta vulgaris subsp. vulgaris TaxID=3555 RepID=UPI0020369112|nr:protein root UVB sensitive 5 isoform X2 [Beta vulgaris subsp. vulgaris]
MSCILHSSISVLGFSRYSKHYLLKKSPNFHSCSFSSSSNSQDSEDDEFFSDGDQSSSSLILVERYSNGASKRYILDGESSKQTLLEQYNTVNDKLHNPDFVTNLNWLPDSIKDFILPAGFPGSWCRFFLRKCGCGICCCNKFLSLYRWVSKDGIGAVGRLIIGGRFGNLFDDDPKQWRMYADFIGSAGSIFDITTQLYPAYFLPLASLGNLAKAVARGLKDPSFRVIQNHFAMVGNLGDVSAKEEVWEVGAQFIGLALGIFILDTPGLVKSYPALLSTWMSIRLFHLWLRYQSLSVLQFKTINLKRARILAKAHVLHSRALGCIDCNREENILVWQRFLRPRMIFGVPFSEVIAVEKSSSMVKILKLYTKEKYVLTVHNWQTRDFEVLVSFKVGATSLSVLQSVWQAYWLHEHWDHSVDVIKALEESLINLEQRFDSFMELLEEAGWNTQKLNLNVPKEPFIEFDDDLNS